MKKYLLFFSCLLGIHGLLQAQVDVRPLLETENPNPAAKRWRFSSIGIGIGPYHDALSGINTAQLLNRVNTAAAFNQFDFEGYTAEADRAVLAGGNVGLFAEFHLPTKKKGGWYLGQTLRVGLSANMERELMVHYYTGEPNAGWTPQSSWLGYCLIENELQLSATYLFSVERGILSLYGGPGANLGGTFNNLLILFTDQAPAGRAESETGSSAYARAFATMGLGFRLLPRLSIFGEFSPGLGFHFAQNSGTLFSRTMAGQVGLKVRIMK